MLDVMIQAGGLTDFADGNRRCWCAAARGGKQYSLRLKDLLKRGDISANVAVLPGRHRHRAAKLVLSGTSSRCHACRKRQVPLAGDGRRYDWRGADRQHGFDADCLVFGGVPRRGFALRTSSSK